MNSSSAKHPPSNILSRFLRKPFSEKKLFLEALLLIALTRFVIVFLPFKALGWLIGKARPVPENLRFDGNTMVCENASFTTDSNMDQPELYTMVYSIAKVIRRVSNRVPWEATCLVQAAAGKIMLNRRNLPGSLFLGVNKHDLRNMEPHAWLTSDSKVILGGGELEKYTVVSTFT